MNFTESKKMKRTYKDSLFCSIFGKEEHKHYLLDLYNALNKSNYTNVADLEFTTIENVIYITIKNDVSFLIGSELNLYEQQSTFNPNLSLRGLMYFSQLYQMYLSKIGKDLYGTALVKIPTPKFVVFYNGKKELDDVTTLKLSDAFEKPDTSGNFEWTSTVININKNHNSSLLNSCKALYDYTSYVEKVKSNIKSGMNKDSAVDNAVDFAIKNDLLNGFFKVQKSEVLGMSLTEFDEEEFVRNRREEGAQQAKLETARRMFESKLLSEDQISNLTDISMDELQQLKQNLSCYQK